MSQLSGASPSPVLEMQNKTTVPGFKDVSASSSLHAKHSMRVVVVILSFLYLSVASAAKFLQISAAFPVCEPYAKTTSIGLFLSARAFSSLTALSTFGNNLFSNQGNTPSSKPIASFANPFSHNLCAPKAANALSNVCAA